MHPLAETDYTNLLKPDVGLMVWTLLVFFIVLWVLKKYAFGPLAHMIEQRQVEVRENLASAERTREEAQQTLDDYRRQLAEARQEAATIVETTRRNAEDERKRLQGELAAERERGIAQAATSATQIEISRFMPRRPLIVGGRCRTMPRHWQERARRTGRFAATNRSLKDREPARST